MTLMERRRALMMAAKHGGGRLPAEYQEVEWIGLYQQGKYLNTGVAWSNWSRIETVLAKETSASSGVVILSSFVSTSGSFSVNPWGGLDNGGNNIIGTLPNVDKTAIFDFTPFVLTNKIRTNWDSYKWNIGFGYNANANVPSLKIKTFVVFDADSNEIYNGIPCYRKADAKIGLYDIVAQAFSESEGTFTKGADV